MFSGIIDRIGIVVGKRKKGHDTELTIRHRPWRGRLTKGESIAVDGICLTVIRRTRNTFSAELVPETMRDTTAGRWGSGTRVNLERSLQLGGRLSGHFVFGHVDGTGKILSFVRRGRNYYLRIEAPPPVAPFLVRKGSVAVDGISLTIQKVSGRVFETAIIPETAALTAIAARAAGGIVNLEADMIAKQVCYFLKNRRILQS